MTRPRTERAGIGFRVKTGYASAIILVGPASAPAFAGREHVLLADLDDDDSRQPYHAGLHRGAKVGTAVVRKARRDAERRAGSALRGLLQTLGSETPRPRCIGLVVGSNIDPLTLGNLHIRAHAMEGRFYREVLEAAAQRAGLQSLILVEREAFSSAAKTLRRSLEQLQRGLTRIGAVAGRPWRRDEQLAALAAWLALAS
jgi:hypothetical protein